MLTDENQAARSFRFYFLAECRRRWWHALLAVAVTAIGVALFKPLGISDFVALGAVCVGVLTAVHVGGSSLPGRKGAFARRLPDLPRVERRRWFLAAMLFGVVTSVVIAAAAAVPAIASLARPQMIWEWADEAPRLLALLVAGLCVVGFVCGHSWACCTRGWSGAPCHDREGLCSESRRPIRRSLARGEHGGSPVDLDDSGC